LYKAAQASSYTEQRCPVCNIRLQHAGSLIYSDTAGGQSVTVQV